MGLEQNLPVFTTRLQPMVDFLINWGRKNALWPFSFGTACCAIEFMGAAASRYDLARFGAEVVRFSPRQADMLIVLGRVCTKMVPVLQTIYEQMAEPKWVVAMGACCSSGGMFNNYAVVQGIDRFLPVDVYIPGCPPHPEDVLDALIMLQKRIAQERPTLGLPDRRPSVPDELKNRAHWLE